MTDLDLGDRLAGCILGLAAGDALGFVVESAPPAEAAGYVREYLRAGRVPVREPGPYPFPFGQYSDDTQLARELLIAYRDRGAFDPVAYAARLADLFGQGRAVGAGPGTEGAARRLLSGIPWAEAGTPPPYAGNGAAIRAGPIGLLAGNDPEDLIRVAAEQGLATHRDPRARAGAVAIAGAVALAARPDRIDSAAFLHRLAGWVRRIDASVAAAVAGLGEWIGESPARAAEILFRRGLDPGRTDPTRGISPFVTGSVAWSLYAFLRSPDDYWETICTAIAVGGDTDSLGAMAGGISGARLGPDVLPTQVVEVLGDRGTWGAEALAALGRACAGIALAQNQRPAP